MSRQEMQAVLALADDQIFRQKFIDRKIPGYKYDQQQFESGQVGVEILRQALKQETSQAVTFAGFNAAAHR